MQRLKLRSRLQAGERLLGTFVKLAAPEIVEQLGLQGFDFVVIDMEHASLTITQVAELVRAADAADMPAIVRVPENNGPLIQRVLDAGARGVQVPHMQTEQDVRAAVASARYYPEGHRGLSFSHRAARYGLVDKRQYIEDSNRGIVVVAQIESEAGLAALPALAAVPGCDVIFFGPTDLSQDMGLYGDVEQPAVVAALEQAFVRVRQAGGRSGLFAGSVTAAKRWLDLGAQYLVVGTEQGFLAAGAKSVLREWSNFVEQ